MCCCIYLKAVGNATPGIFGGTLPPFQGQTSIQRANIWKQELCGSFLVLLRGGPFEVRRAGWLHVLPAKQRSRNVLPQSLRPPWLSAFFRTRSLQKSHTCLSQCVVTGHRPPPFSETPQKPSGHGHHWEAVLSPLGHLLLHSQHPPLLKQKAAWQFFLATLSLLLQLVTLRFSR